MTEGAINRRGWFYPLLIVVIGFCYYITYFNYGIRLSDEGFLVDGAERVLRGQLPVSDFMSYPPGSYLLLALFFRVFGTSLLVSRYVEIAFLLANGLMMFYVGKRLMPKGWALIPSFILIAFPGPWYKVFFVSGLLLPLCALIYYLERRTVSRMLLVGWANGIAFIFKIEPGVYSSIMIWIVLFVAQILGEGALHFRKERVLNFLKDILLWFLAIITLLLPIMIYYYFHSSLRTLFLHLVETYGSGNVKQVSDLFMKPSLLTVFTRFNPGGLHHHFFFVILFLYLYMLWKLSFDFFIRKRNDLFLLFPVVVIGILSLSYAYVSFSLAYIYQVAAPAYILLGYLLYSTSTARSMKVRASFFVMILLLTLFVLNSFKSNPYASCSINTLIRATKEGVGFLSPKKARVYLGKKQLVPLNGLVNFFRDKEGYLMPLYYEPMVNFLTGLENPTRFAILHPLFLRDESNQYRVIDEVEKHEIQYLTIYRSLWESREEDFGFSRYAPILYEFVSSHYKLEKDIEGYLIFSRCSLHYRPILLKERSRDG